MRVSPSVLVALVTLGLTLGLGLHTFADTYDVSAATAGRGPVFYPRILLAVMAVLCVVIIAEELRAPPSGARARTHGGAVAAAILLTGGYVFAIPQIGFLLATIPFAFALPLVFGVRRPWGLAVFAVGFATAIWYLFDRVFQIILPKSPWFVYF